MAVLGHVSQDTIAYILRRRGRVTVQQTCKVVGRHRLQKSCSDRRAAKMASVSWWILTLLLVGGLTSCSCRATPAPTASDAFLLDDMAFYPTTRNERLVHDALVQIFINRNTSVIPIYWSSTYRQHNPQIPDGREALSSLVSSLSPNFKYEPGIILSKGQIVMMHGRYTDFGGDGKVLIGVDMFRVQDHQLIEHWDVLEEEVPAQNTTSGRSMWPQSNGV